MHQLHPRRGDRKIRKILGQESILELMNMLLQNAEEETIQSAFLMVGYLLERLDRKYLTSNVHDTLKILVQEPKKIC